LNLRPQQNKTCPMTLPMELLSPPLAEMSHPLPPDTVFASPGGHFVYQVIGPCCPLFDREQLPWPCCRLQWRGKEPSWRRIGRRFVPDLASRKHPSYYVEILGQGTTEPLVLTLHSVNLAQPLKDWWLAEKPKHQQLDLKTVMMSLLG
jgi:hypothetical protein